MGVFCYTRFIPLIHYIQSMIGRTIEWNIS